MTIIEMLNRLSEIAPDTCKITFVSESGPHYTIGKYTFRNHNTYGFLALWDNNYNHNVPGRPALAWLRDALEEEVERHGWNWREEKLGKYCAALYRGQTWRLSDAVEPDITTALLAAFLAVMEGER